MVEVEDEENEDLDGQIPGENADLDLYGDKKGHV